MSAEIPDQALPVLVAGCGEPSAQHHQRDMYLPALRRIPATRITGVWDDGVGEGRAAELAAANGLPRHTDLDAALDGCRAVVACPRADRAGMILGKAAERGLPVLLDKPTLLGSAGINALVDAGAGEKVTAAHHWRYHDVVASARGTVRSGGLGLLHAVHAELLVGGPDGPEPRGELRNLAVYVVDVVQSLMGPLRGTTFAVRSAPTDRAGESWTIALRLEPDVVVTILVGRTDPEATAVLHRYRLLGSHGQLFLDLAGPRLSVIGRGARHLSFGPSSVDNLLRGFLASVDEPAGPEPSLAAALELSHILDAIEESATSRTTRPFGGDD